MIDGNFNGSATDGNFKANTRERKCKSIDKTR